MKSKTKVVPIVLFLSALIMLVSCGQKQDKVERIIEDGAEVIINHIEPYQVKGEPSNLILEKVFSFDTEKDEIAATGLTDIYRFDIDSDGNIYFLIPPVGQGNLIYKFDRNGNLITSFVRRGQGPYELEYPHYMRIINRDEILIIEPSKSKSYIFSRDGLPIKETPINRDIDKLIPLENGKFLILFWHTQDMDAKYFSLSLNLYSSGFKEIKELDRFNKFPNRMIAEKIAEKIISGINYVFVGEQSGGNIYTGNCERGYEILVYDLEGNLLRKIRKEYKPVEVPDDYKKEYLKPFVETEDSWAKNWGEKIYFPKYWYPFYSFFPDDEGRLFVMTFEEGENPGEYIFDIFNSEGIFIARKSLKSSLSKARLPELHVKAKMNYLYCLREKESGYKELVVYKMRWE